MLRLLARMCCALACGIPVGVRCRHFLPNGIPEPPRAAVAFDQGGSKRDFVTVNGRWAGPEALGHSAVAQIPFLRVHRVATRGKGIS
jgi:hypothetical protein